jgi:hypothetical protein
VSRLGLARTITPVRLPHCSPNLNAQVERFIQTVQIECLDRFIVMGTSQLDHLVREFMEHYNRDRPHSAIGFRTPVGRSPPASDRGPVRCRAGLGGVIRYCYRVAALGLRTRRMARVEYLLKEGVRHRLDPHQSPPERCSDAVPVPSYILDVRVFTGRYLHSETVSDR